MSHDPLDIEDPPITWSEVRDWAEFFGWTTLALVPFLYWVNGPAVSDDQFVVRCILVAVATLSALGVRGYKMWQKHTVTASGGD